MIYKLNKKNIKMLEEQVDYMNEEFKYEGSSDTAFILMDDKKKTCQIAVLRMVH